MATTTTSISDAGAVSYRFPNRYQPVGKSKSPRASLSPAPRIPPAGKPKSPNASLSPAPRVQQDAADVDTEYCESIIAFIREGTRSSSLQERLKCSPSQSQIELNDVSPKDQVYIASELVKLDHFAVRFTCFPHLNQIILTMPSTIHEAPINTISSDLNRAIDSIDHDPSVIQVHVGANTEFGGTSFRSIPDLLLSIHTPDLDRVPEPVWIVECGFAQSRKQIMKKFERYVTDSDTLRVLTMVNIVEHEPFANPSMKSATTRELANIPVQSFQQWSPGNRRQQPFGPIVTHHHTWMSISSVEVEIWIAKQGGRIDLSDHDPTIYASGSLHPDVDTEAVDDVFKKALEIVRDRIVVAMNDVAADEQQHDTNDESDDYLQRRADVRAWSAPLHPVRWQVVTKAIVGGLWWTAFERYQTYHTDVRGRRRGHDDAAVAASSKKPKI